ncbi:MAG TPA: PilN domain-containing protein [Vicinamibacteria bacterium]|nr:PilN domain-containing protein [Vicinamibacteria bacterium]
MIRINLLAPERAADKKKKTAAPAAPGAFQAYLLLTLFAGGAAFVCAAMWWFQTATLKDLDAKITVDEKRQRDLQAIKVQVDAFQQKKTLLERKVDLIEKLKAQQKGPVHMLDEISKALPDYVWLTALDEAGGRLTFAGESNSLTAVADFISALQRSGWFNQVDLVSSTENDNIVAFNLAATFKNPEEAATAGAPTAPKS